MLALQIVFRSLLRDVTHCLAAFFLSVFLAAACLAQTISYTQGNIDQSLRSDLNVDPSTLGMSFSLTLGAYAGRGPSLPVTMNYGSKVWRINYISSYSTHLIEHVTQSQAEFSERAVAGWTTSLDAPYIEFNNRYKLYDADGQPRCGICEHSSNQAVYIERITLHMPDGSAHELRKSDTLLVRTLSDPTLPISGVYVAVDGSRLKYDHDNGTVYLPDGSRYLLTAPAGVQYIDSNGNTLTQNPTTKQWTDTLGRVIGFTLNNSSAHSQIVTLPGLGTSNLNYTLVWKNLQDALAPIPGTNPPQYPALRYDGDNYGGLTTPQIASPSLFQSDAGGSLDLVWVNNSYPPNRFNPVVLGELILPNGQKYVFSYNEFGEMAKVTLPTGGYQRYEYAQIPGLDSALANSVYRQANRGVVKHAVCVAGNCTLAQEHTWTYSAANTIEGYVTTVTNAQGAKSERRIHAGGDVGFGFDDARAGLAYEERTYSATGQMLRRTLVEWSVSGPLPGGYPGATRDPRGTKKVEILLDTGGNALAATTTTGYDNDLNEVATNRYDYVPVDPATAQMGDINSFPLGALLRAEESTFLVNDPNIPQSTRDAYRARHLISLPSYMRVTNGSTVVAETQFKYDEAAFPLLTYGVTPTGWANPGVNERGNVTTTRRWLNLDGSFLETHAQYDQCGNLRKAWDGNGKVTETFYNDSFSDGQNRNTFAYASSVTTPVPDPTGNYGSNQPFTSSTVFDFSTGKVVTTTDANNKTTGYFYAGDDGALDGLQRLRRVTLPDGLGETKYEYGDTPGDLYVRTLTKQDATTWLESCTNFDGLGRPWRSGRYEGPNSWSVKDTEYDSLGRVKRVTNPYLAADLSGATPDSAAWTTTTYDDLNRVLTVTAPDGATVQTTYSGNRVTVQDPANKRRLSETDALGRLVKVIEDPGGLNYETTYLYDVLGNLRKVTQGAQTRWFAYDSLSRLIRVKNPEQNTNNALPPYTDPVTGGSGWSIAYSYDANGNLVSKTDARNITTNYGYDALNRNTTVDYSDTTALNPDITRVYDNINDPDANGKGRLWLSYARGNFSNGTDTDHTAIDSYDALGRPLSVRQHFKVNGVWKPGVSVGYKTSVIYDLAGAVKTMTYPSGRTVNYSYDDGGRLSSFIGKLGDGQPRTYSTITQYHPAGMIERETFGTQTPLYNNRHYNNRLQLVSTRVGDSATDEWNWSRGLIAFFYGSNAANSGDIFANDTDNNGNLRRQINWVPLAGGGDVISQSDVYTYDALNRISSFTEAQRNSAGQWVQGVAKQDFSYDPYGNRHINPATAVGMNSYNPDYNEATNRINGLGYDAAGNITNDLLTGGTMIYDAENRLLTASSGGTYTYDANGKRTRRTAEGRETWYIYGVEGELLAEYDADGAPSAPRKEYGYRGGQLLIIAESGSGGGVSLVKPGLQSKSDLIGKIGPGAGSNANRILSTDEPFTATGINKGHGSIAADFSDDDNTGTPVRGGPWAAAEEHGNASSANDKGGELLAKHLAGAQPAAPQKEYSAGRGPLIVPAQSSSIVTVNPGANQTPDPGQGGEAVSSQTNMGHGSETSTAFRGTKGVTSRTKTCLWHSFPGVSGGTKTRVSLKFDWTLIASINVSVFEESFASAVADYDFRIEYSLDNGSTWIGRVGLTDFISMDAPGSDGRSINTSGSESIDLPNPGAIDITRIRVRDRIYASATLANSPDGSASGITIATVSNIRLEVEIVDDIAPVITGVLSSAVTHNSATISWNTNENSDSQVEYGTSTAYGQTTALDPARVIVHSQGLFGLAEGTPYHYRVSSRDAAGNLAISGDFTFTTADITAPVIANVEAVDITTTGATITWTTNENSDSQVEYRTDTGSWQPTALNQALVTVHSQGLSGLTAGTLYRYRVKSKDAAGNLTTSAEFTFTTAQNGSSGIKWLVTDHLGSTRMVIDETGSLEGITRHDYAPFGEELYAGIRRNESGQGQYGYEPPQSNIRQKFGAKERDIETGLDYFSARYYASLQGRFTSVDPIFVTLRRMMNPQELNLYAYARNNPLRYIDPNGAYLLIDAKTEEEAKKKFELLQQGLNKQDRSHVSLVVGDGKNGFAKGTFGVRVDKDYSSKSTNFQTVREIATNEKDTAVLSIVGPNDAIPSYAVVEEKGGKRVLKDLKEQVGMDFNVTFKGPFAGYTFFPAIREPLAGAFYSKSKYTEVYVANDAADEEIVATIHHELRHVVLGDFGRSVGKAGHNVPASHAATAAAEEEARQNFKSQ